MWAARSTVEDVPIEKRHVPNLFAEATLVRDGRVYTESRELFVPPVKERLDVAVSESLLPPCTGI